MSEFNITIPGGESKRLLTGGKYCPADIVVTAEGGSGYIPVEEKDVNFYDYDGTLLYSYTLAEAQALTELPPLPTQDGLICQGWNWTLAELLEQNSEMDVGAIYITADGKTRAVVELPSEERLTLYLNFNGASAVVEWGDGRSESVSGTGMHNLEHRYDSPGEYTIAIAVVSGKLVTSGNSTDSPFVGRVSLGSKVALKEFYGGSNLDPDFGWIGFNQSLNLRIATIPEGVTNIANSAFPQCKSLGFIALPHSCVTIGSAFTYSHGGLSHISLPPKLQSLGGSNFRASYALRRVCIPQDVVTVGGIMFYQSGVREVVLPSGLSTLQSQFFDGCDQLREVILPEGLEAIAGAAVRNCTALARLEIPASVSSIGANAFYGDTHLGKLIFLPSVPPTVANANAFELIPTDCVVEVPAASLAAYQNATNYSGIAVQMVGV